VGVLYLLKMRELIRHIIREHTKEIGEMKKITTPEFIEKAKGIHGDKYDYSKVVYSGMSDKVKIICPKHGIFEKSPANHLKGQGCSICAKDEMKLKLRLSDEDFIKRANKLHKGKYNYPDLTFRNNRDKIKIICPIHGEFSQSVGSHLNGNGCPICGTDAMKEKQKLTTKEFIELSKKIHGNRYDYSKVDYKNANTNVIIGCKLHGDFLQEPSNHTGNAAGCPICGLEDRRSLRVKSLEDFIKDSQKIHGDKYDYSNVDYKNTHTKVKIICAKHGEFSMTPSNHIGLKQGCPYCQESKGEREIGRILKLKKIPFISQHRFIDCTNKIKGRYCRKLPFDFYLPKFNSCVEFDGLQHFQSVDRWGGEEGFQNRKKLDKIKTEYCEENGIKLIRIPYTMKKEDIEPYILSELGM
jgi:hypothetical protein